jgi:hypothetical protein
LDNGQIIVDTGDEGTVVHLETQGGANVLTFAPNKTYQSVVFSSPMLENGATYPVFSGGKSTGTATDGLYSGGSYTAGHQETSLTLLRIVTGGNPRGGGFRGAPRWSHAPGWQVKQGAGSFSHKTGPKGFGKPLGPDGYTRHSPNSAYLAVL